MPRRLVIALVVWLALISVGGYEIYAYETTAGATAPTPVMWPDGSALTRAPHGFTVVMFVHPDCSCTEASLGELGTTVAAVPDRPRVIVVFLGNGDPRAGDNGRLAGQIGGAARVIDDGREARAFGARTSGHVMVYGAEGALEFSGGITESRGMVGDNVGRASVENVLRGRRGDPAHSVFGCSLENH